MLLDEDRYEEILEPFVSNISYVEKHTIRNLDPDLSYFLIWSLVYHYYVLTLIEIVNYFEFMSEYFQINQYSSETLSTELVIHLSIQYEKI